MRSNKEFFNRRILYVILDQARLKGGNLAEAAWQAAAGGADLIQYRGKQSSARVLLHTTRQILKALSGYQIPLIINDRLDIALATGAEGVHLGLDDLPVEAARKLGGEELIIGASARSVKSAREAEKAGADYLGVGSFFPTSTKSDARIIDHELFSRIVESVNIPLIAIGGINESNLFEAFLLGASGVAVASAIFKYQSIEKSVRTLKSRINQNE